MAQESYQFGGVATCLDWVEVTDLFWNINHTYNLKYDKLDGQGSEMIGSKQSGIGENIISFLLSNLLVMALFLSWFHAAP